MRLAGDGAELCPAAITSILPALEATLSAIPSKRAGTRLYGVPALGTLLAPAGSIGAIAASFLGTDCRAVRATLFDKSKSGNWSLPWHQDRTIAVTQRIDVEGFGQWTVKAGVPHVEPPADLQAQMMTLRVHLDPVPADNAPLMVAPGSHRLGRIRQEEIADVIERCGTATCLAEAGDAWAYATPILHASEAARSPNRRRVLQVDYAATDLPGGLHWLGV